MGIHLLHPSDFVELLSRHDGSLDRLDKLRRRPPDPPYLPAPFVRESLDVAHQAIQAPLRADLGAPAQREPVHMPVMADICKHRVAATNFTWSTSALEPESGNCLLKWSPQPPASRTYPYPMSIAVAGLRRTATMGREKG